MYIAGYIWGMKIRSVDSAPKDAPETFLRGVEDGYGDGMRRATDAITKNKNTPEQTLTGMLAELDKLDKLDKLDYYAENRKDYLKKMKEPYWQDDQRR